MSMDTPAHRPSRRQYQAGCRCLGCRTANAQYKAQHRMGVVAGVPVTVILTHLRRVPGALKTKARAAGVSWRTLLRIGRRLVRAVHPTTAQKILALPPRRHTPTVPSYRTKQLLKGIVAEGWSLEAIAREIGVPLTALACRSTQIKAETAAKVEALYQRLMSDEDTGAPQQPRRAGGPR